MNSTLKTPRVSNLGGVISPNNSNLYNIPPLVIETPNNFSPIFTFSNPNTNKHDSLDNIDKIQNIMELESHIHNLKGHNAHNEQEIKKLKDQIKILKQSNLQEEIKCKKIKDQYIEAQEEIKGLREQQSHNELGYIKIKELNKSLQEQNLHNMAGIDRLKENIKTLQDKISVYENEIKTLTEQHNNDMIDIKNLQKQPIKYKIEAVPEEPLEKPKVNIIEEPHIKVDENSQKRINELEAQILFLSKQKTKKEPTGCW